MLLFPFSILLLHYLLLWPRIFQNNSLSVSSFPSLSVLSEMTSSSFLSSARNSVSSHFYLSRNRLPRQTFLIKSLPLPSNPSLLPLLRFKNSKFAHPFASISSFAEAGGEEDRREGIQFEKHEEKEKNNETDLPGMAQAFHISSRTASAISILIVFAVLSLPLFMKSLGQGLGLKTKLLSYATLLFGFDMAWNIGANDVANAMGTSVRSGALSLRQAVLTAQFWNSQVRI